MKIILKIIISCLILIISLPVHAVDPRLNWKSIETQNFIIHYADGYQFLAQKTANIAEHVHSQLHLKIHWQPENKTHLIISDESDTANGFATSLSFSRSVLFMAPPQDATSLEDFDDWLETLITHEYTHILHLDKTEGAAAFFRKIFGRQFLLFPNTYQPNWFIEGLATYYETDVLKGIGRGQSSLFQMMMRSEVAKGVKPVSQVNLPIRSWPMGTVSYLYGVHFYQFIEAIYGQQGIDDLIKNYSDNVIPFMINTNSKSVLNKDLTRLWADFSDWLNQRYQHEIESQQEIGLIEGKKITEYGYNTDEIDQTYFLSQINDYGEQNKYTDIFYVTDSVYQHSALMQHKNGKDVFVTEVHRGAKINAHAEAGVLVIQNEFCDEYNINSDLYVLMKDELKRITKCGRYRSAAWAADGQAIIAVKTEKSISRLVLLSLRGEIVKNLWQGNNTDIVTQIKVSPLGKELVAAVFRKNKGWNIEIFDLEGLTWSAITDDKYIDMYPSYSEQGKVILFSSERPEKKQANRYQIYRYIKENKTLQQITRVASGAFSPLQANSQSPLFYVGYHVGGRDIYQLDKVSTLSSKKLILPPTSKKSSFKNTDIPLVLASSERKYSAFSSLYPRGWTPFISLSEDRKEYGFTAQANDALGVHNTILNLAYDTQNKWLVGGVRYAYANRFSLGYRRSTNIIRDNQGDFAIARNVDDLFMSVGFNDRYIEKNIQYQLGVILNESLDGVRAPGISGLSKTKDNLVGGAVVFRNSKNYIRSISQSDGRNVRLLAETTELFESDFSGQVYTLDWREFVHLGEQNVMALRLVQGWGTGRPSSFRLGGENTDFDLLDFINPISEPLFDKRNYTLRGYTEGLPELRGRRMQLATAELRIPGSLIERGFMSPPLGIIQWSSNLFVETGAAYNDASPDKYYSSIGFELQGDINLFYGITSKMRLGFARGLDERIGEDRFYFSLGSAF